MAEENATESGETSPADPAAEVVAEALTAMQQDELASPLAAALKNAWDGTRFDVAAAVDEIRSLRHPPS